MFRSEDWLNPLIKRPSIYYELKKLFNPDMFQGSRAIKNYFEGWYFKVVSENGDFSSAFIPGISIVTKEHPENHSFVQVIDGKTGNSFYFRYAPDEFKYSPERFEVAIGPNYFSTEKIILDLLDNSNKIKGEFEFSGHSFFPVKIIKPGIMGWYRYLPFMECYHGIVSMNNTVKGYLYVNDRFYQIQKGRGYIEKDWGKSMPKAWIWLQTNNLDEYGDSFMLSIATIPYLGYTFSGFLGFLLIKNKLYNFGTYTGAKIKMLDYGKDYVYVEILFAKTLLKVKGLRSKKGELKAPLSGSMERTIHESIDAVIELNLYDKQGNLLFSGTGKNAGLEIVGKIEELVFQF